MYIVTYSLKNDQNSSNKYYKDVADFTNEVILQARTLFQPVIEKYNAFINKDSEEVLITQEEAMLELLILGTLWRVYSGDSSVLDNIPQQLLVKLGWMRQQSGKLKPGIDFLKGILSTMFLSPDLYDNMNLIKPNMENFEKLITWLSATGEFSQEVKKLQNWKKYLLALENNDSINILASTITLALWFEESSEEVLGDYTTNVDRYLNEIRPNKYWHEDIIFCGRRRVEYHLNMVGAEIMNKAFKDAFNRTCKKVLLLPACMRLMPETKCKSEFIGNGYKCLKCTKECNIYKLTKMGQINNFEVVLVPHESSISAIKTNNPLFEANTGVIGVSCVLNLISGGWLLKEMGIPAQCVLLDYCGCKNHWHSEGLPTCLNVEKLRAILK